MPDALPNGLAAPPLQDRTCWIFDMDGTLTESLHDFAAISRTLGLLEHEPILESLARLSPELQAHRHQQLHAIELYIAHQATAQPGAYELLSDLREQGKQIGILTRNDKEIAHTTLAACGLADFFRPEDVIGRGCCAPKPKPDGILQLLAAWSACPSDAVMVGDHKFDLLAGRHASAAAVYLDPQGDFPWQDYADYSVTSLTALRSLLYSSPPAPTHP
jgi:HAD superfamily hydrolase (TIGR01549 family)